MTGACSFPWFRFAVTAESTYACCISGVYSATSYQMRPGAMPPGPDFLSLGWNSPGYQTMRELMRDVGVVTACELPDGCASAMPFIPSFVPEADLTDLQRANRSVAIDSFVGGETVVRHYPVEMEMILDTFCNLRCIHCSQRNGRDSGHLMELKLEAFADELHDFLAHAERLILLGGEPTISPRFDFIMDAVDSACGAKVQLVTNGQLIRREILPRLASIAAFHISVDAATADTYHKVRRGGSWDNLISGLTELAEVKGDREMLFHNVIHPLNLSEMEGMVELAARFGGDRVRFDEVRPFASLSPQQVAGMMFTSDEQISALKGSMDRSRGLAASLGVSISFGGLDARTDVGTEDDAMAGDDG